MKVNFLKLLIRNEITRTILKTILDTCSSLHKQSYLHFINDIFKKKSLTLEGVLANLEEAICYLKETYEETINTESINFIKQLLYNFNYDNLDILREYLHIETRANFEFLYEDLV